MIWNTTEPPKDKIFLADVGVLFPVVAVWNENGECFSYANLLYGMYDGIYKGAHFENEHIEAIQRWMPMPSVTDD